MISSRLSAVAARNRRNRVAGLLLVCVLLAGATIWRVQLSGFFWGFVEPLMLMRFGNDVSQLKGGLPSTAAALADRDALYRENLELKARFGRASQVQRILGGIISRPPATPYDTLVIDAGSAEGIAQGDLVSAGGTAIVGIVSEVYTHAARVTLYSSPGEKYDALLRLPGENESIPVAIEGQGGGSLRAQVPAGTLVSIGDDALLPGVAGGVSARVSSIEKGEGESFVTLYFNLPADIFTLRFVEVWKQPTHDTE